MASTLLTGIREAADVVRSRTPIRPDVGIVLGTGLGDLAGALEGASIVPYAAIPGFPVSTVESHAGELHVGRLANRPVAVMKGRVHCYEGYSICLEFVVTTVKSGMKSFPEAELPAHPESHIQLRR